jgi:hypothetical protein
MPFLGVLTKLSPVDQYGPAEIYPVSKEKMCQDTPCFDIAWNMEAQYVL